MSLVNNNAKSRIKLGILVEFIRKDREFIGVLYELGDVIGAIDGDEDRDFTRENDV